MCKVRVIERWSINLCKSRWKNGFEKSFHLTTECMYTEMFWYAGTLCIKQQLVCQKWCSDIDCLSFICSFKEKKRKKSTYAIKKMNQHPNKVTLISNSYLKTFISQSFIFRWDNPYPQQTMMPSWKKLPMCSKQRRVKKFISIKWSL